MQQLEFWPVVTIMACGFVVGMSKGGFAGVAVLSTPIMTAVVGPELAVGASLPMLIVGDLVTGWRFFGKWDRRVVLTMIPGAALGVALATPLLPHLRDHEVMFSQGIGLLAIGFAFVQMVAEQRRAALTEAPPAPAWVGVLAGVGTGVTSTLAHQGGVVSNLYMLSQHLTKERFAATATGVYLSLNCMKLWPYLKLGVINGGTMPYSIAAMPAIAAGVLVGAHLLKKLDPKQFAGMVQWLVVVTGLKLLFWP